MIYYTDGSAHPKNPGPGGFGVVKVFADGHYETYSKQTKETTTNNREELRAIIWACADAMLHGEKAEIYSDSTYAMNSLSTWMEAWQRNGWVKSSGGSPDNLDLIIEYYNNIYIIYKNNIYFNKVKGHSN